MTGHLTGPAGVLGYRDFCEAAILSGPNETSISTAWLAQLRQELGSERAAFVVTQLNLQAKAAKKLQPPGASPRVWWCTDRALQQATPWQVAKLKATWFGNLPAYDLCCGIGGDACHLAARGGLVAVDIDPLVAELAAMNLRVDRVTSDKPLTDYGSRVNQSPAGLGCDVVCADVTQIAIPPEHLLHVDPDRRPGSKRASRPEQYQPAWENVVQRLRTQAGVVVKLAPAADPDLEQCPPTHRCWISLNGSVREQSLLSGQALLNSGLDSQGRSAIVLRSDGAAERFVGDSGTWGSQKLNSVDKPLGWIVDPDAAIRAAGLTEDFGAAYGLSMLGRPSGFLTSADCPSISGLAQCGTVLWSGSCDDRKLRKELRQRNVYPDVIKVRGTDHHPETLMRKYRKCGETPVQLWIGRGRDRVFAAMTESRVNGKA